MAEQMTPEMEKRFVKDSILYFYESKTNFEAHKENFENIKSVFEDDMEKLYDKFSDDEGRLRIRTDDRYTGISGLQIKKVQPVSTEINYEKFRRSCKDANVRKKVIRSSYKVTDMPGLLKFLQENGIRYKDVKQFIKRNMSVDVEKLENLVEVGEIDEQVVRDSVLVRLKKPYYKITPVKPKKPVRAVEV